MIHPPPRNPSTTSHYKSKTELNPWLVEEDNFPASGETSEQLEFLLNYAVLDPLIYNTQPWFFKIIDDAIELYADTRVSATANSSYRELMGRPTASEGGKVMLRMTMARIVPFGVRRKGTRPMLIII